MSAHVPALPLEVDPLIAEAKRRARRRRLIVLALAVSAGIAVAAPFALESNGGAVGVCATPPSGWKERDLPKTRISPATVVLTNFRFGRMDYLYGLNARLRWPAGGVMIAVRNDGPAATPRFRRTLRVDRSDFRAFEGMKWPAASLAVRSHGRVLGAYVEARTVTPATVAAANQALAGVHTCSP